MSSTASDMLAAYLEADAKLLKGKSVSMNGRNLTRADLDEIRAGRQEWERRVAAEARSAAGLGGARHSVVDFSE